MVCLFFSVSRVASIRHTVHVIHRWLGRLTLVMAFVNMMLGYSKVQGGIALYIICAVWFVVGLVLFLWPLKSSSAPGNIDLDDPKRGQQKVLTFGSKLLFVVVVVSFCVFAIVLIAVFAVTSGSSAEGSSNSSTVAYTMKSYSIPNQMTR